MKSIFLSLLLTIVSCHTYAQAPFAPAGATWHFGATPIDYWYGRAIAAPASGGMACASIDMYEYHKGYPPQPRGSLEVCSPPSGDTVFYRHSGKLIPLYIFNVNAGDTVSFYTLYQHATDSFFRVQIDSVKPRLWGNAMLRTVWGKTIGLSRSDIAWCGFALDTGSQVLYVERLGAINGNGLLPWSTVNIPESPGSISCYYDGTTDMRRYGYDSCTGEPVGVTSHVLSDCRIYPNPVSDYCILKLGQPLTANARLLAYDVCGSLRFAASLPEEASGSKIDMIGWPAGVYMLTIATNGQTAHWRVIKQ